jgi:hypothetical protein
VTLDKSWFYYITEHEVTWLAHDRKVPNRERVTVQSRKVMLAVVGGQMWFAVVTAIESGCKFKADYYVSKVITRLSELLRVRGDGNFRKLIVHADNLYPPTKSRYRSNSWPGTGW